MNIVYIVIKNGEVDEVFTNRIAAEEHAYNLLRRWNRTQILEKELKVI